MTGGKDRKKSRFNVIDLVIVLFIILALVGIFIRFNIAEHFDFNSHGDVFEIEFYVENVLRGTERHLQPGAIFHIHIDSVPIGEVIEILDVRDAVSYATTIQGDITRSYSIGRVDITGVMRSRGRVTSDGHFMINGNAFVTAGVQFLIHTEMREVSIMVMSVRLVD
jgi:hypothetical protein